MEAQTATQAATARAHRASRRQRMGLTGNCRYVSERAHRTASIFWPHWGSVDAGDYASAATALHAASFMADDDSDSAIFLAWASEAAFECQYHIILGGAK